MYYNQVLTTDELITEMRNFKWTRKPKEAHFHHTWKPTAYSFNKAVEKYGLEKAYSVLNNSMKTYHIKTYGGTEIAQHLTFCPDGKWIVGRNWNKDPISIKGRNYLGFAIETIGNFDIKGLRTTSENSLGYDKFHDTVLEKEYVKFMKFFVEFFGIPATTATVFHNEHSTKTCPGNGINKGKVLRLIQNIDITPVLKPVNSFVNIKIGDKGDRIKDIQTLLNKVGANLVVDGSFGNMSVAATKKFQADNNITASGIIDITTYEKIQAVILKQSKPVIVTPTFTNIKIWDKGERVLELQKSLNILGGKLVTDSSFGNAVLAEVKKFQTKYKLPVTGIVDSKTWDKIVSETKLAIETKPQTISLWKNTVKFNSNIKYCILPQDKYFVHYEKGIPGKFERVSDVTNKLLKEGNKVAVAINGGFFGGNQDQLGLSMDNGSYTNKPSLDYIDLFYRRDGKFIIDNWDENTPNVWANRNAYHWAMGTSFSLIQNGVINTENMSKFAHAYTKQPRTMIGQKLNGDIVMVVVDGRSNVSAGVTGLEAAEIMYSLGCYQAANLDGGGSTTATETVNGVSKVVNKPCDKSGERYVGSMLIAYVIV